MKKILLAPSILSANFLKLGKNVKDALTSGGDIIHMDIMDNHYVPNLSFGPFLLKDLKKKFFNTKVDVHIMASPSDSLVDECIKLGADFITIHLDSVIHLNRTLQFIRNKGCKAGIAVNPSQSLHFLDYVIDKIDLLLIMTVDPGYSSQTFIRSMLSKIKHAREKIDKSNFKNILLSVDGGINVKNINSVLPLIDIVVVGSEIFNKKNICISTKKIKKKIFDFLKK